METREFMIQKKVYLETLNGNSQYHDTNGDHQYQNMGGTHGYAWIRMDTQWIRTSNIAVGPLNNSSIYKKGGGYGGYALGPIFENFYRLISYHIISYHIISYHIISYHYINF